MILIAEVNTKDCMMNTIVNEELISFRELEQKIFRYVCELARKISCLLLDINLTGSALAVVFISLTKQITGEQVKTIEKTHRLKYNVKAFIIKEMRIKECFII